ncbi:MAG: secretion ATPase [Gammaproteobacteria bacterium]|nr:MAG: secretion ATPase [Gammaproteobacteria bacterium]TND01965.1 MAG: secretion ATPase [Gammaproteobacteria bacterium]
MYEHFYGLHTNPFRLTPDPQFFFASGTHNGALAYLRYGMLQCEGFIVVTGESGAGKTELSRMLLSELQQTDVIVGELAIASLEPEEMLYAISDAFGLTRCGDKASALKNLRQFMLARVRDGQRVILLIDEAQNLPSESIEELRMLSNLQFGARALFQCILLGTIELRNKCDGASVDLLKERVIAAYQLSPLLPSEVTEYIEHRLRRAGWEGNPRFTDAAYMAVNQYSGGNPRRINLICQRLLLCSSLEKSHVITDEIIARVIQELYEEIGGLNETFGSTTEVVMPLRTLSASGTGDTGPARSCVAPVAANANIARTPAPEVMRRNPVVRNGPVFGGAAADTLAAALPPVAVSGITVPQGLQRTPTSRGNIAAGAALVTLLLTAVSAPDNTLSANALKGQRPVGSDIFIGILPAVAKDTAAARNWQSGARTSTGGSPVEIARPDPPQWVQPVQSFPDIVAGLNVANPPTQTKSFPSADVRGDHDIIGVLRADHSSAMLDGRERNERTGGIPNNAPVATRRDNDGARRHWQTDEDNNSVSDADVAASDPSEKPASPSADASGAAAAAVAAKIVPAKLAGTQVPRAAELQRSAAGAGLAARHPVPGPGLARRDESSATVTGQAIEMRESAAAAPADVAVASAETVPVPVTDDIPRVELDKLVSRFTSAYQQGNLASLSGLLADDVKTNDSTGRNGVTDEYRKLFDVTEARNMVVTGVRWSEAGDTSRGEGEFTVTVRAKGRRAVQAYLGRIRLEVERRNDNIVISELRHTYSR